MTNHWMQTYTGRAVSLLAPRPDQIDIADIALHLSRIPRFVGATSFPYSVAQHSLHVLQIVKDASPHDATAQLWALLHDAHEAYIGDISTPMQRAIATLCPGWAADPVEKIKTALDQAIAQRFGLSWTDVESANPLVKRADLIALATEKAQLLEPLEWPGDLLPPPCEIELAHNSAGNVEFLFRTAFERHVALCRPRAVAAE